MIAVIFEVEPHAEQRSLYLDIASDLKPVLEKIDGFISVERFQSITNERKILSLSFFRDEETIHEWRTLPEHREAQSAGRETVFENYRLRVAGVIRDYGMFERDEAPADSQYVHLG